MLEGGGGGGVSGGGSEEHLIELGVKLKMGVKIKTLTSQNEIVLTKQFK